MRARETETEREAIQQRAREGYNRIYIRGFGGDGRGEEVWEVTGVVGEEKSGVRTYLYSYLYNVRVYRDIPCTRNRERKKGRAGAG